MARTTAKKNQGDRCNKATTSAKSILSQKKSETPHQIREKSTQTDGLQRKVCEIRNQLPTNLEICDDQKTRLCFKEVEETLKLRMLIKIRC